MLAFLTAGRCVLAVVLPFESPNPASLNRLVELVAPDMERVNATILARTGSEVAMIPEVANHLIASGGKRLRPMLTLAMARLAGYSGDTPAQRECSLLKREFSGNHCGSRTAYPQSCHKFDTPSPVQ
jgi:hypothetical protein